MIRVRALVLIMFVAACSGDAQPDADSAAAAQSGDTEPTPAPGPASKIGQLPLLASAPPGGKCTVTPFGSLSVIKREIVYEVDYPVRVIRVAVGDSSRAFAPISFEAMIRREIGVAQDESESVQAFFDAGGNVSSGNRRYVSTGSNAANERKELFQSDPDAVKQLALQVMDYCKDTMPFEDTTSS